MKEKLSTGRGNIVSALTELRPVKGVFKDHLRASRGL
jgi:hypothetical protein